MRLFTAVDIPTEVRARLEAFTRPLRATYKLQWSAPEKLHITTKFIGEWPEDRLAELIKALETMSARAPIAIAIRGCGWFPADRHAKVLSAGVEAPGLAELAKATARKLATIGIPVEDRVYTPHLTLARRRDRAPIPQFEEKQDFGAFWATHFALYLSHGGKYTQLREFSFT